MDDKNTPKNTPKNTFQVVSEYVQALVSAVLLAILIRGFVFEPFKIPSESMVPTLMIGDHIFVARYKYGLRIPFTKIWIKEFDDPQRGDVVVFNFPDDEDIDFIKRVVGVPGDRIVIKAGKLFVNDKETLIQDFYIKGQNAQNNCVVDLTDNSKKVVPNPFKKIPYFSKHRLFQQQIETFESGQVHTIQRSRQHPVEMEFETIVPARSYFVMGDNRDESHDSRFWGFVPRENLKGKAQYIWLSLNHEQTGCAYNAISPRLLPNIRWDRFGREII